MPIPLAKNSNSILSVPTSNPGRVYNAGKDLIDLGKQIGNTMEYLSKAANSWGDAIMKVKQQNEISAKNATILELSKTFEREMTNLEEHDGFEAEEYRNKDFKNNINSAVDKAYKEIESLSIKSIKEDGIDTIEKMISSNIAKSEIYAFNQKKSAQKQMNSDMLSFYTRETASMSRLYGNDAFDELNEKNAKEVSDIAASDAELEGINDKNYIELKKQQYLDSYHSPIAKEIAASHGYNAAMSYMEKNKNEITSAAKLQVKRELQTEMLTYEFTLNPNNFLNNGVPNQKAAEAIAPDLRPEERLRIINIGRSAKSGSKSGSEDLTPSELNGAVSISKRFEENARSIFEKNGIYVPDKYKDAQMLPAQKKERLEGLKKISDNTRLSDLAQAYFDNVYVPSSTQLVMKQNAFGQAEAMPVRGNYIEQRMQLAAYANDPNVKILSNISALSKTDFDDLEGYYRASVADKDITDGLDRGWVDPVEYNILDAIGTYLASEYGYTTNQIADVFQYMLEKQRLGDDFVNAEGKIEHKSYLKGINLTQRGLYDELSRQHNNKLVTGDQSQDNAQTSDAIEEIQYMLASYIKNEGGSATIGLVYEKAGVSPEASKTDLDKFFNRLKMNRENELAAGKLAGTVRGIAPAGTPLFLTENRFLYK